MSILPVAGAAGLGLAWGWLLARLAGGRRPLRTALAAAGATALAAGAAWLYAGAAGAAALAAAVGAALLLHLGQRRQWARSRQAAG